MSDLMAQLGPLLQLLQMLGGQGQGQTMPLGYSQPSRQIGYQTGNPSQMLLQMLFGGMGGAGQLGFGASQLGFNQGSGGQDPSSQMGNPLASVLAPAPTPGGSFPTLPWNPGNTTGPSQLYGGPMPGNLGGLPIAQWQGGT